MSKINSISNPRLRLSVLSTADIQRIHTATLDVMETVGVRFPSTLALDILESHGARVDRRTMIARIPGQVVEAALAKAPPTYTLGARDPALDLVLDGQHLYLSTDGTGVEVIDIVNGQRRRSLKRDVGEAALVADYLDCIAFHWPMVAAQDCPIETRGLHEIEAILHSSTKHIQSESLLSAHEARGAVEMAAAVVGGREALRQRPIISLQECAVSPLGHDGGSLEAALVAAETGLPVGFMTMASMASTGPASMAGNLVIGNAEVLSGLVLIQLAYPGASVYYSAAQTAMDLRTGGYTGGGPEDYLFATATGQLADFYNVPLAMGTFATGAKEPGWQSAFDDVFSGMMSVLGEADMMNGAGCLHGSRILDFDHLVMESEVYSALQFIAGGIEISDDTLALDVIRQVGPGGTYLTHPKTRRMARAMWQPALLDRRPFDAWEKDHRDARQSAHEKALWILANHRPEPLEEKLAKELERIIESCRLQVAG
jgi:trimethylamine--corrinoid protein Co-methyltransferase